MTLKRRNQQLVLCLMSLIVSWLALPSVGIDFSQEPVRLGEGRVWGIAISPDGSTLAAGRGDPPNRDDTTIRLWDLDTQEQIRILRGHSYVVGSVAFSPNGKTLASGGWDDTIRLWDLAGQEPVRVTQTTTSGTVAFSPDGRTLASSGYPDHAVRLWDVQTLTQIGVFELDSYGTELAFSPDGKILAYTDRSTGTVVLSDVAGQMRMGELVAPRPHEVRTYSPDGKLLATAAGGGSWGEVYLWDVQSRTQVGVLGGHSAFMAGVAFSPDGKLLAAAVYWDPAIHVWDVAGQEEVGVLIGHHAASDNEEVVFSPDGRWLACASRSGVELWEVNLPGAAPIAARPEPSSAAEDVFFKPILQWTPGPYAEQHDVYFGTNAESVNDASASDPAAADSVYRGRQDGNSYTVPDSLNFDQTYYWRVDEVNAAPDSTVFKGDVWSFTTEPFSIPISNIAAASSSEFADSLAANTVNGSGVVDDLHGITPGDMWISTGIPATIEYTFDRAYRLHELWIWNSNQTVEPFIGFGAKDVVIEHSLDGENWTVLEGVGPLAQALGKDGYAHNNTIDLGGVVAQRVRMTINSVQGIAPQASLSEVRFYSIPSYASHPQPADGVTTESLDVTLQWRPGREAVSHEVLLSSDPAAVQDGSAVVAIVNENSFRPGPLNYGTTYTWQVNEVNEAEDHAIYLGDPWTFTASTPDFAVVDDMEAYRDEELFEIWATWVDGFDDPANGSTVGNGTSFAPETDVVHSGVRSLPIHFDNNTALGSWATRNFDPPQNWSQSGAQTLVFYFLRGMDNIGESRITVEVNDTRVVYQEAATLPPGWDLWTQWNIDLTSLTRTDLAQVESLTIGIEGAGAQGVIYVDDIRLYANAPEPEKVLTWFEAESGTITAPLEIITGDVTASGDMYIGAPQGTGDSRSQPTDGVASYSFTVPEDGVYRLAFRVSNVGGSSFWVRIPGMVTNTANHASGWVNYSDSKPGLTWHWEEVVNFTDGVQVVEFTLSAGAHTLEIARRHDGKWLDAIAVIQ